MWRTIALSLLLLGSVFSQASRADEPASNAISDRARSAVQGLLQTGKPEDAFVSCVQAVMSKPDAGATLRDLAAQALSQASAGIKFVTQQENDPKQQKQAIRLQPMQVIRKIWPALINPSAAALFASKDEYDKTVNEFYQVMFDYTFSVAQAYQRKGYLQDALVKVDNCIAYKPGAPDPRAVQFKVELKKQIALASPSSIDSHNPLVAPTGGGEEFRLQAPQDDGSVGPKVTVGSPELCLGESSVAKSELVFPNLQIPKDAHIKKAVLRGYYLKPLPYTTPPFDVKIHAEDTDNAEILNTQTTAIDKRMPMKTLVNWLIPEPDEGWVESPDIAPVIQAAVNRPGWAMGHNLGLLLNGGFGTSFFISYDQDPQRSFRLVVDWQ